MVDKHTVVIFSDEWTTRNKQVKNFLKSLLHLNKQKIDARKCDIKIIDNDLGRNFCEEYHIQGSNNLAYQFYKDSTLWWILSVANPDLPNDSLYPTLGFQLRIPSNITQILRDFNQLNS